MKKDLILNLAEDLIDEDRLTKINKKHNMKKRISNNPVIASTGPSNIHNLMMEVAKILVIPMDELLDWVEEASISEELLKIILRIAKRFKLNPLFGHIAWEHNAEGNYEVYIPIDGWIALIHQESRFQGLTFNQSIETESGIPIWMECTIYRSDLTHPVTIREYLADLKTDHSMWQVMPRRMLRHKSLQQCARLAFGISIPEPKKEENSVNPHNSNLLRQNNNLYRGKNLLKEKLLVSKI